jgi:hypothetical protein
MNRRTSTPNDLADHERIDLLEEAYDSLEQAIANIRRAVRGTGLEAGANAYLLPTLIMSLSDDHEYLGHQSNVAELIQALFDGA